MKITGKWIVISTSIIDRKLHIKGFHSEKFAIDHAKELHQFADDTIATVQVDQGRYITSFDNLMNMLQVTRVIEFTSNI